MNIQKYLDLFEYKRRDPEDPTSDYWSFKLDSITNNRPEYNKLSDLMRESALDRDSAYTFTVEALQAMQEIIENEVHKKVESFYDLLSDTDITTYSEAPGYNSELTDWLAKGSNWTFVDEVIAKNGNLDSNTSIIDVIQLAYTKAWEEHYFKVLEAIK